MAPASVEMKSALASLVASLLGLEEVGDDENFFALGGEAVFVEQLAIRLHERFGIELSPDDIHSAPTVADIAALFEPSVGRSQPLAGTGRPGAGLPEQEWNIARRFLQQATGQPHSLAVREGNDSLTYGELKNRCLALERCLRAMRSDADRMVALVADRSCDLVVGLIASMLSGLPCLMLSPRMWKSELARAAAGKIVLTQRRFRNDLSGGRILLIDEPRPPANNTPRQPPEPEYTRPTDVALAMHSTGESISHAALVRAIEALEKLGFPAARVAQLSEVSSCRFLVEVWSALARGGTVHMVAQPIPSGGMADGILEAAAEVDGSLSLVLPVAAEIEKIVCGPRALADASVLVLLGRDPGAEVMRGLRSLAAQLPVLAGVDAPGLPLAILARIDAAGRSNPIFAVGKPVAGVSAKVMDQDGMPVEPGRAGEVWVCTETGDQVSTGWPGRLDSDNRLELLIGEDPLQAPGLSSEGSPGGQPWTSTHHRVAGLWKELLNAEDVGPDSDFFALGGNSLLAMRMVARVNTEFGTDIPWALFLHHPTVADLATAIDKALPNNAVALRPSPRRDAAQLLASLEHLSDDQVEALLREMEATP